MDRRVKGELFEEIRQGFAAGETIQGLATTFGIHWRMVRQAISAAIPPAREIPERERPKPGPIKDQIEQILRFDLNAPPKPRHTAHRIWIRLREEHPEHPMGERTVRRYVAQRKRELGLNEREVSPVDRFFEGVLAAHRGTADAAGTDGKSVVFRKVKEEVNAGSGLRVKRMLKLAHVSRASFYRFDENADAPQGLRISVLSRD